MVEILITLPSWIPEIKNIFKKGSTERQYNNTYSYLLPCKGRVINNIDKNEESCDICDFLANIDVY